MFNLIINFVLSSYHKFLIVAGVIFLPVLLSQILLITLTKYLKNAGFLSDDFQFKKHFHFSITALLILLSSKLAVPFFELSKNLTELADKCLNIALIIALTAFFINITALFKLVILNNFDINTSNNLKQRKIHTQIDFIERIIEVFLIVIAFSAILLSFDGARKIGTSLIASAGVAGIILGFAAQKTIGNLVAGFQIAFTQPFKIDDVVVVDNEWGRIEEITLTYVVIKLWDLKRLVVPINYMLEKPFQNWTRNTSEILGYVYIYADYSVNIDELRNEFNNILANSPLWDGKVSSVQVTDSTEKSIQIRFLMSGQNASDVWELRAKVREEMIKAIQDKNSDALPKSRIASTANSFSGIDI